MFRNTESLIFEKIPLILLSLIPFFLIAGPFLADLSVVIISLIFLAYCIKKKDFSFFNNFFFKFFFIFYLCIIFSSIISDYVLYSLKSSITFIRFLIFVLAFSFFLNSNKNLLRNIFYTFTFCFFILIVDGHIQYFTESNIFGWPISKNIRVSSLFHDEYILGSYISRLFPIYVSTYIFFNKELSISKLKYLVYFNFFFSGSLVFISGERVAFLYFLFSIIFFLIFLKGFKFSKLSILFVFIISISLYLLSDSKINDRMISKTLQQVGIENLYNDKKLKKDYFFSKPLDDLHKTGFNIFLDNYLFGIGPKNFRNKCKDYKISEYSCNTHPHNTYIQLLSETGLIGFLFIFSILIYLSYKTFKTLISRIFKKKMELSNFQSGILCAILITLFPLVPTGSFFNNWMLIVYSYPVGIWLWSIKK